jgi:hypothetical protein
VGKCDLCHEDSGLLGREHPECKTSADRIRQLMRYGFVPSNSAEGFGSRYEEARTAGTRKVVAIVPALDEWKLALDEALEDGVLSADEEERAIEIAAAVGINQQNAGSAWWKLIKAGALRDLTEGKIPERLNITGITANLMKKERPVWHFSGVQFFEERTSRSFAGVSHGLSIRIAKGVYYRPSAFRGSPVETTKLVHVDDGGLLVTSHHMYFLGSRKSFRVSFRKIVSFQPFKDAIGIQRDAMTAKPQFFKVDDPWFAYNLVTNLASISGD